MHPFPNTVQTQKIPLGPVAPMVAIKQLGSNGGGWYLSLIHI
nr:potassium-transporting ATPase subunit KdpA [Klebsiella pneumoniae]